MFDLNFDPRFTPMVARLVPPEPMAGLYIVWADAPGQPPIVTASPTTLPAFAVFGIRHTPHFPYGYHVEPD